MRMTRAPTAFGSLAAVSADTFWTIIVVIVIGGIGVIPAFVGWYWFVVIPRRELSRHGGGGPGSPTETATRSPSPSYGRR
jgi:hypothetical protein